MNEFIKVSLRADSTNLEKGFAAGTAAVGGFRKALHLVQAPGRAAEETMKKVGRSAAAMGAALLAANVANSKSAMDLERSMRNVNSIARESEDQFRRTGQAVLDMSRRIPQTATNLADGLYDIASSGFQGADALEILERSGTAAIAGMTDTAVASKGIAAVLNAYNRSAGDAADISDVLFQTVNVGVLTFEELVLQLGDFLPLGQAINATFEEQAAAMAALTRAGFPAAQAATALTGTMRAFIKPSEDMSEAIKQQGYESGALMIEALGLQGAIEKVTDAVNDDQTAIAALFQDTEGLRGVLALTANEGKLMSEAMNSIADEGNRAGATQETFEEQSKSLAIQIQLMKNNFNAARTEIGQYYLPTISKVATSATFLLGIFGDLPGPVKGTVAAFMALAQVGTLIGAMLLLSTVRIKLLKEATRQVSTEFPRLGAVMGRVVGNGRSMIGMTSRLSRELLRWSGIMTRITGVQTRFASGMSRVRVASGAAAAGLMRVSSVSTRAFGASNRLTTGIQRLSAALTRYSTGASTAGARTQRLALIFSRAGRAGRVFGSTLSFLKARVGLASSAFFLGLEAIQSWAATAKEARQEAEALNEEVFQEHDTNTLKGMSDAYSELYEKLSETNEAAQKNNNIFGAIKGTAEIFSPFNDNNVQKGYESTKAQVDLLDELREKYNRQVGVLNAFTAATGLSAEEGERLAEALGVDLSDGLSDAEKGFVAAYNSGEITKERFLELLSASEGVGGSLVSTADSAQKGTTNLSELGEQMKALRSPLASVTGDVVELTDAQKELQSTMRSIASAGSAWSEALGVKQEGRQSEVDDELDNLEKISDARIEAKEEEVEGLKSGSAARKRAQRELENLRDREREVLADRREELQKTVEDQKLNLSEYASALEAQNTKLEDWKQNLVAVTTKVTAVTGEGGEDVARYLAAMGEDGIDIVTQLANGTDEETKRMAEAIRKNMETTSDEAALELDAGLTVAAQIAGDKANQTRDAIINKLGLLPGDAHQIMSAFGKTIESELNSILVGLGGEPIDLTSNWQDRPAMTPQEAQAVLSGLREAGYAKGGFSPEGQAYSHSEPGTGGEWHIPMRGISKTKQKELWVRAGQSMGVAGPLMGFSGGGGSTTTHNTKIEKNAPVNFTGPMHLSDPREAMAYAERRKRLARLKGG